MENRNRADRKKQEDIALTRALIWFSAAMILEFLLLLVNKYYVNFTADSLSIRVALAMETVLKVTAAAGLIGAVISGVRGWKRMNAEEELPFMSIVVTAFLLAVGISSVLIVVFYRPAVQLLYLMVPLQLLFADSLQFNTQVTQLLTT